MYVRTPAFQSRLTKRRTIEVSMPHLPLSIRRFMNDGGQIASLDREALDELGRCVVFDRTQFGFNDWDTRVNIAFGPIDECDYPYIIWRQWDSEIANNDGDLADRILAALPNIVVDRWQWELGREVDSN